LQSTHKWMVYVRGPRETPNISHIVKKAWFFLHPSYRPNDLVEVTSQPFHLTRRGKTMVLTALSMISHSGRDCVMRLEWENWQNTYR